VCLAAAHSRLLVDERLRRAHKHAALARRDSCCVLSAGEALLHAGVLCLRCLQRVRCARQAQLLRPHRVLQLLDGGAALCLQL
jgi:hypothetical protein